MPEGPECRIISEFLYQNLVGKSITSIQFDDNSKYARKPLPGLDQIQFPIYVEDVFTKGKKIIIKSVGEKNLYFVSSLGMEGKWLIKKDAYSNLWIVYNDLKEPKKEKKNKIYFSDSRHFGHFEIIENIEEYLAKIGPDLLQEDVNLEEWLPVVRKKTTGKIEICKFLLEQKYFSGIGNYLRAEILYRAKIKPNRILDDLSDEEHNSIRKWSMYLIRKSYLFQGCTLRSYVNSNGEKGSFKLLVYGQKTDPEGNPVQKDVFSDNRTIHWVPNIQH